MIAGQPVVVRNTRAVIAAGGGTEWERVRFIGEDGTVADDVSTVAANAVHEVACEWFALCDHTATRLEPHPVLGEVPICDRCKDKIDGIRNAR